MDKKPKRPRDINQLAKRVVDMATGSNDTDIPARSESVKDPEAVSLGGVGASKAEWPGLTN